MEIYFLLGGFLTVFYFGGNLIFHYYYLHKHNKFLNFLSGKKIFKIQNVITNIDISSSKSIFNYQVNMATVIVFDEHIFLLIKSKYFKIAQPILEISKISSKEEFPLIWEKIYYVSKQKIGKTIRIKGYSYRNSLKIDYLINLDFSKTNTNLDFIEYLNEKSAN